MGRALAGRDAASRGHDAKLSRLAAALIGLHIADDNFLQYERRVVGFFDDALL